jgi:hypothetical protein
MKWLIFALLFSACGVVNKGGRTVYWTRKITGAPVTCRIAKMDKCGMTLEGCDNGSSFFCVHGVEMGIEY